MFKKKKKIEEISSNMESNVHLPYLFLGSEAYLIDDASISSSLQRHKPINIDMISDLSDNILHHILSFLSTKIAITTSILSKRWRYLWTYLPVFSFLIFYNDHLKNPNASYSLLDILDTLLRKSNHHLVEKKELNILIPQVILDEHKITSLVTSLLGLKVKHLKISILDIRYLNTSCVLPSGFSASHSLSILTLKLGGYTLYIPTGVQFPGLKTLNLHYATFASEESVEQFFSGCPLLEELSLNYCYWLYIKKITIAIPTLRILSIHSDPCCLNCDDFSKISVKIDVVNLLSLTCISNPSIKFVIVNPLTSMVEAHIAFTPHFITHGYTKYRKYASHCAVVLLSGLVSVKSLTLSKGTIKGIYTFTDYHDWTLIPVPCCFKSSLNKLHVSKFDGSESEIQFVEYFLENATLLEEFQISLSCWSYSRYNLTNLTDLKNRFVGIGSCVIKFRSSEPVVRRQMHYGS